MNLAFQALVILTFLAPGLIYRNRYNRGKWNYPIGRLGSISEQIPKAIIYAAFINAFWAWAVTWILAYTGDITRINYSAVVYWMSNSFVRDAEFFKANVDALASHPGRILCYFGGLYLLAFILGESAHRVVRWLRLDRFGLRWLPFSLRYENDWFYIFEGEVLSFTDDRYKRKIGMVRPAISAKNCVATAVAAVVETKAGTILYVGILVDYFFDGAGNLDRLLLTGVRRRAINDDEDSLPDVPQAQAGEEQEASPFILTSYLDTKRFYPVNGHYFILRMSEVKTLNVDYLVENEVEKVKKTMPQTIRQLEARYKNRAAAPGTHIIRP